MGSLLLKLGELLTEEYKLQAKVKEDVEYLKRELTSMHAALCKVGDVPRDELDEQVKIWADDVRDLSYRMEDIVDKFLVCVKDPEASTAAAKPRKLKRLVKGMSNLFTKGMTRHEISDEIKVIKARVQEAADRRDRFKVTDVVASPAGSATVDPRLLALYKDRKELVGIDDSVNELTRMLLDGDGDASKQLKMLSIAGFGGLGKTTLAKAVYDKIEGQFDCGAFVPVGRNPSRVKLLNDVLFGISNKMYPVLDERQLIDEIRQLLENERYFIVIDDIWDEETWSRIKCAFVDNNCGSRIITTTRILEVATTTGEVYRLKPLSQELSAELFNTRLFGGKSKCSYGRPTEAYDKILHKCGGIPLAITTMASLLVGKPVESWSKVYNSIGFGNEDNKDVDIMRKILLFSYYDLPCHLRTCLLYLSIYPEDHMIEKDSLIWKWVAEGFVQQEAKVGLSETGERYFNELINKSMIEPVESSLHDGIIIGCRVHDMVFDMINVIAKEENFVTVLDRYEQYTSSDGNARRFAVGRRLALHHARPREVQGLTHVLSLTIFGEAHPSVLDFSKYELLRVLDLEECYVRLGDGHLKLICTKLLLLRYLCLGFAMVTMLPKEIRKLRLLDTLDVRKSNIEILPTQVLELPCLVHLFGKFKLKQDVGDRRMSKLQTWLSVKSKLGTLAGFVVGNSKSQEFPHLMDHMKNLTKVKIWCEATADTSSSSHLSKGIKGFIERSTDSTGTPSLSLSFEDELTQDMLDFSLEKGKNYCCYLGSLMLDGSKICSLPSFVAFLGGLTKLGLSSPHLSLSQDFLATLSKVRGLTYLKLVATILGKLIITEGTLKSLSGLSIVVESTIYQLEIQEGALPCLKSLQLLCKYLDGFSGISAIKYFKHIDEIALHHQVSDKTKHEWTEAAKNLPSPRPKILFL